MTVLRLGVYLVFLLSGAAGLVYEVLWVRQLTWVFGISTYAIATVLAAFMAGLALGSFLFGRVALRVRRVLVLYGLLEIGIGIFGWLLPHAFAGLQRVYGGVYDDLSATPWLFATLRALVLGLLLLVPTTLMGGTISVLAKFFKRSQATIGRDLGKLYAFNTLGAVVGCLTAGFWAIPEWGVERATQVVVIANLLVGVAAMGLQLFVPRSALREEDEAASTSAAPVAAAAATAPAAAAKEVVFPTSRRYAKLVVGVFAVSGLLSLGYQVLWTRTLVFYLHNSTYAFTTMLAVFLLGLSFGSLLLNRRIDGTRSPSLYLALAQGGIAASTMVSLLLFALLPLLAHRMLPHLIVDSWGKALGIQAVQAFAIVFPPTFFMGLTFPVVTRIVVRRLRGVSAAVGDLYSFNTMGCIFGSLLVGFFLLPRIGIQDSFRVLMAANLLLAVLVLLCAPDLRWRSRLLGLVLVGGLVAAERPLLPDGLFQRAFEQSSKILYYRDGATDTVMVRAAPDDESVRVIAFADGRGTAGTMTAPSNRFMGHLPMILHPEPKQALSICFGVGNTLAAIAAHEALERLDCVELSPGVIEAADFFPTNEGVVHHPKVHIHEQDGRNWLLGHDAQYDVIQLEPPEIHTDGVVNLYTREFYRLCKRRLAPGGLLCQWLNVQMIPLREQRMLLATFQNEFPQAHAWMLSRTLTHVLLIGGDGAPRISWRRIREAYADPVLGPDLREKTWMPDPVVFLANFKLGPEGLARFTGGVPLVTDDLTRVDFTAPRSVDANYGLSNGFSGHKIACQIPGGVAATNAYYADKLEAMLEAIESPLPWIQDFASEQEREEVRRALEAEMARWREQQRAMIEAVRAMEGVLANT